MIPALLYMLLKKFRMKNWANLKTKLIGYPNVIVLVVLVILLFITTTVFGQTTSNFKTLKYTVYRNGDEVGWINLSKFDADNRSTINLASEITFHVLFKFSVKANEKVEFMNGKMIHSYIYRKMNGSVKADKHTRYIGNGYEVEEASGKKELGIRNVSYNVDCLYFKEPTGISQVYSDNFQQFVPIEKKPQGYYKIKFPDGNSSNYYYKDGVCAAIHVDHTWYSADIILNQ
jgi:hypothetical protein